MKKFLKTAATALMFTCMAGNVCAATQSSACASNADINAVRTAAVQQRLMVAALSCHAVELYNKFVKSYQGDLQASDRQLQNFFRRLYGQSGEANYHSFKTRLANTSSMQSIKEASYCADAEVTFDDALSRSKKSLTAFVATQPSQEESAFSSCDVITASAKTAPARPAKR
jgi:hypothetical protein